MIKCDFNFVRPNFKLAIKGEIFFGNRVVALVGDVGSGKSTLLKIIAGLEGKLSGYLSYNGRILMSSSDNIWIPPYNRNIVYVSQTETLFPHLKVRENIRFNPKLNSDSRIYDIENEYIKLFKLSNLLDKYPFELSGGQKQLVATLRAIMTQPELLLLDEPLSSLDLDNKTKMLSFYKNIFSELNINALYVSHLEDEISQLTNTKISLLNGNLLI